MPFWLIFIQKMNNVRVVQQKLMITISNRIVIWLYERLQRASITHTQQLTGTMGEALNHLEATHEYWKSDSLNTQRINICNMNFNRTMKSIHFWKESLYILWYRMVQAWWFGIGLQRCYVYFELLPKNLEYNRLKCSPHFSNLKNVYL